MADWDKKTGSLRITTLQHLYRSGKVLPKDVITAVLDRIDAYYDKTVFICRPSREAVLKRVDELQTVWSASDSAKDSLPLFGIPYAVKDNLDIAGYQTTAACPEFSYEAKESSTVVKFLEKLGAIMIGKTNMDQFASGLVGTRSPYGAVHNSFNTEYISGGSSSGSGVAVSVGLCSFALGTDTAGSGRVPGGFNNVVGLKPTRGVLSAKGVVAACRMLDCVAVFALTPEDARTIFDYTASPDEDDRSRENFPDLSVLKSHNKGLDKFTFGVPKKENLKFFEDKEYERLYWEAVKRLESLGGTKAEFDYSVFTEAARMLYAGPPLAERLAYLEDFLLAHPDAGLPLIRAIMEGGYKYTAVDTYKSIWRLSAIRKQIHDTVFDHIDFLVFPTTPTIYKIAEVEKNPYSLNANLGYYTNFVNLLDLCGVAVPNGFTKDGLPMGVTIMAPAFSDEYLLDVAEKYHKSTGLKFGASSHTYEKEELASGSKSANAKVIAAAGEGFKITKVHTDKDGASHIGELVKPITKSNWNGHLSGSQKATSITFRKTEATWSTEWQHLANANYLIQLEGTTEVETSDGTKQLVHPGEVVLFEDVNGKGHKLRAAGDKPTKSVYVTLGENPHTHSHSHNHPIPDHKGHPHSSKDHSLI